MASKKVVPDGWPGQSEYFLIADLYEMLEKEPRNVSILERIFDIWTGLEEYGK